MLDDILMNFATETPEDDNQRLVHDSLKRAFGMYEMDRAKDAVMKRILRGIPGTEPNLERQNLELDIAVKKRRLGLQDTDDLNRSINGQIPVGRLLQGSALFLNRMLPDVPRPASAMERWLGKGVLAGQLNRYGLGII